MRHHEDERKSHEVMIALHTLHSASFLRNREGVERAVHYCAVGAIDGVTITLHSDFHSKQSKQAGPCVSRTRWEHDMPISISTRPSLKPRSPPDATFNPREPVSFRSRKALLATLCDTLQTTTYLLLCLVRRRTFAASSSSDLNPIHNAAPITKPVPIEQRRRMQHRVLLFIDPVHVLLCSLQSLVSINRTRHEEAGHGLVARIEPSTRRRKNEQWCRDRSSVGSVKAFLIASELQPQQRRTPATLASIPVPLMNACTKEH